jgi:uncharacterized membrane protein YedE/YeeE
MKSVAETSARPANRAIDWAPYLAGGGIGALSWVAFAVAKDPLGVTTAYSRLASLFAIPLLGADGVARNSYWKAMPLSLDYGVVFLGGLMLGAFASALLSGNFRIEFVPANWRERFGGSIAKRMAAAFLGGVIIMYGARLAGGCTSGHAISGGLQLALSSWIFLIVLFLSGLGVSALIYRGQRRVQP